MVVLFFIVYGIVSFSGIVTVCHGQGNDAVSFTTVEERLFKEYAACTNDTAAISLDSLLSWRKKIEMIMGSPEYPAIRKEYYGHLDTFKTAHPCVIINWYVRRLQTLKQREDSLKARLSLQTDRAFDSLLIAGCIAKHPRSSFDFQMIPFGIPRSIFNKICTRYGVPVIPQEYESDTLWIEHHFIDTIPYTVAFLFTKNRQKRYYKYVIFGYFFPAESLNTVVRPQALLLQRFFEKKIGAPSRLFRLGLFDIKRDSLNSLAQWIGDSCTARVSIHFHQQWYRTVAQVGMRQKEPVDTTTVMNRGSHY